MWWNPLFWLSLSGNQKDTSHFGAPNFETPWVKIGRSGFSFGFLKPPPPQKGINGRAQLGFLEGHGLKGMAAHWMSFVN